jgi:hypothetical protein
MSKNATRLVSPNGFASATIDGAVYEPDEKGVFHIAIPAHAERLKRHPFNFQDHNEALRAELAKSDIDLETASTDAIAAWLRANGVEVPDWHTILKTNALRVLEQKAAGASPESIEGSGLVDPEENKIREREPGAPFVPKDATWAELKEWLTKKKVEFRGNDPKTRLVRLAEDVLAAEAGA